MQARFPDSRLKRVAARPSPSGETSDPKENGRDTIAGTQWREPCGLYTRLPLSPFFLRAHLRRSIRTTHRARRIEVAIQSISKERLTKKALLVSASRHANTRRPRTSSRAQMTVIRAARQAVRMALALNRNTNYHARATAPPNKTARLRSTRRPIRPRAATVRALVSGASARGDAARVTH